MLKKNALEKDGNGNDTTLLLSVTSVLWDSLIVFQLRLHGI